MKKLNVFLMSLILTGFAIGQDCNDLFVSEIVFGKVGGSLTSGATQFNHSIEIFNPTDSPIILQNYEIALIPENGDKTTISVNGIVPEKDVFVISNNSASFEIASLSNVLIEQLFFEGFVAIELLKQGQTIDKIGRKGVSATSTTINFDSLLIDPNYLNSFDINLGSIENLLIRRKRIIKKGNPDFYNEDILTDWALYPNFEISDLGNHINACVVPILSWANIISFQPDEERWEWDATPVFANLVSSEEFTASSQIFLANVGAEYTPPDPGATITIDFSTEVNPFENITLPTGFNEMEFDLMTVIDDFEMEGDESTGFLFSIDEDNNPVGALEDFNSDVFDVRILDDETTGIRENNLDVAINAFPTIIEQVLFINSTQEDVKIQEVRVIGVEAKYLQIYPDLNDTQVELNLSFLDTGYVIIIVKTNAGDIVKKGFKK